MEPFQGVSIIMPVFNGAATIDRAIRSVMMQLDPTWELLAVDDGSTDNSYSLLRHWASTDARIRVFQLPSNRGISGARNEALRHARGQMLSYLDCDDEYYLTFTSVVRRCKDRGDVLLFAYDLLHEGVSQGAKLEYTWDPALALPELMVKNISVPLGVAHRRDLIDRVGRFEESIDYRSSSEDWDLWKRFSLAGATFYCVRAKSGVYHCRTNSHSRAFGASGSGAVATHSG